MTSSETLWPALSWPLCDGETMADKKTEELISRLEALRGTFESERMAAVNEAFIAWLKEGGNQREAEAGRLSLRLLSRFSLSLKRSQRSATTLLKRRRISSG